MRPSALLVCQNVGVKTDHIINKKEPFWKWIIEKNISILRKELRRIDDWFKGRWKNVSAKLEYELKKKHRTKAKGLNTVMGGTSRAYIC